MFSLGMGVVLCLLLLTSCGGSRQNLVKEEIAPPEPVVSQAEATPDEPLTEELSAKRLEELYAKSGIPGWDPGLEQELEKWDHQVKFDVPIHTNRQVRAYLVYFSTERKEIIRRYLSRSTRYLPMIKEVFQEYGLPEDLAYLAMIESGFNANAYSHAHACGMWQFIRGTGARYGLSMDSYVDERRDPEKSTKAAAKYLLDLYKQFGSWYLAAASYNCGEGRVQRELNQSTHKNFWELSDNKCLPTETKNYVPQMIAATIIAKNPEKFGFKNVPYQPPMALDKVQVKEPTSLRAAAVAVNVPVEEIQALNPELLRGVTPPDTTVYTLNLPAKSKEVFVKNITLASIEHPAVASRPARVARSSGSSRRSSTVKASENVQASAPAKAEKKGKAVAKKAGKKGKTQVAAAPAATAKKGKSGAGPSENAAAATRTASMLPVPAPSKAASKDKGKTQVALSDNKGKAKTQPKEKANGKKNSTPVAKKTDNPPPNSGPAKATGKSNAAGKAKDKGKGKVSQAPSPPLMVSEAR